MAKPVTDQKNTECVEELQPLSEDIGKLWIRIRTMKNMLKFLLFNDTYEFKKIYKGCENLIDSNPTNFLLSHDLPSLSASSFNSIIGRDSFDVDEMRKFRAAKCWIEANSSTCKEQQDLVLSTIRLHHIPRKDLMEEVRKTKLFSSDAILEAIVDQDRMRKNETVEEEDEDYLTEESEEYNEEEDEDYLTEEDEEYNEEEDEDYLTEESEEYKEEEDEDYLTEATGNLRLSYRVPSVAIFKQNGF